MKRLLSFKYACNGLRILLKDEPNARIHLILSFVAITAGIILKISRYEWMTMIFAIGFVIAAEIINTAIENISDFMSPEKHEKIKAIKDLSAAAVLISAMTAFVIGLIIFIPKIILLQ